jgi:hypothetical protein
VSERGFRCLVPRSTRVHGRRLSAPTRGHWPQPPGPMGLLDLAIAAFGARHLAESGRLPLGVSDSLTSPRSSVAHAVLSPWGVRDDARPKPSPLGIGGTPFGAATEQARRPGWCRCPLPHPGALGRREGEKVGVCQTNEHTGLIPRRDSLLCGTRIWLVGSSGENKAGRDLGGFRFRTGRNYSTRMRLNRRGTRGHARIIRISCST